MRKKLSKINWLVGAGVLAGLCLVGIGATKEGDVKEQ
jgi:hypothetical protein